MIGKKLDELREKFIYATTVLETMIKNSVDGVRTSDIELLKNAIEKEEKLINQLEIEIDKMCTDIIALFHPEAKDLRTVLMIYKINNDVERIGDLAVNICERGIKLINSFAIPVVNLGDIVEKVLKMLKDSINSFIKEDLCLARNVLETDNIVDEMRYSMIDQILENMKKDPGTIESGHHFITIINNLERVADLSTNICEDTIYMIEGKVIKHHNQEADQ